MIVYVTKLKKTYVHGFIICRFFLIKGLLTIGLIKFNMFIIFSEVDTKSDEGKGDTAKVISHLKCALNLHLICTKKVLIGHQI